MRSEVIPLLREEVGARNHRLARLPEGENGSSNTFQLVETGRRQGRQLEVHGRNTTVVARCLEGINHVLHQGLRLGVTHELGNGPFVRVAAHLFDQRSHRLHDKRGLVRQYRRRLTRHHAKKQHEDEQQQYQVQDLAQTVDATPDSAEKPNDEVATAHN